MANVNETAVQAVGRAKAVISQAKRKGEKLATQLAKKPAVRQAERRSLGCGARPQHWPAK